MERFKIELLQTNVKGETTKVATAENINVTSLEDLPREIAEFSKDFVELTNKRKAAGIKGYTKGSIRKTTTLEAKLTAIEDETTVSVSIPNFGKWVDVSTKEAIAAHLLNEIEFVEKFSHLWA